MNIKSLLLGSAAALAVVSGAHAADAIVAAEPEPAEYVKVCDAFGTGYFYIPGSETCLKIGGRVRYEVKAGAVQGADGGWSNSSRFELGVSTAAETEYGTLKTLGIIRFNNKNGEDSVDLNEATITLGGLTLGQTDSLFTTMTGYAGNVNQDGDNVGYGPFDTQMIKYTYDNGSGLTVAGSIEHDPLNGGHDDDYVPFFVGGIGYNNGGNGVSAVIGYDTDNSDAAIKVRGDAKFGSVSAFAMVGYNTDSAAGNHYAPWGGDWAVWAGLSANVSDKVALNTQVAYDQAKDFEVSANAIFTVASGFTITPEIDYVKKGDGNSDWGGIVRFDRKF